MINSNLIENLRVWIDGGKTNENRAPIQNACEPRQTAIGNSRHEASKNTFNTNTTIDPTLFMPSTFKVRVWKNARFQNEFSLSKNYAVVGRSSFDSTVDISINEPFVSCIQAKIKLKGISKFYLTNEGVNPISVNNRLITSQSSAVFNSMEPVVIGNYLLKFFVDEYNIVPMPAAFSDAYAPAAN